MPSHPHTEFIARGLFIHQGHLLLCWNPKGDYGYLPGGHIEPNESAPVALAREMTEEAGLACTVGPLLLVHENCFVARRKPHHELNLVFAAEITDPTWLNMCHVSHLRKSLISRQKTGSYRTKTPLPPPPVESLEPHITFRWLTGKDLSRVTIYPAPMAGWAARLLLEGLDSTAGLRQEGAPTAEWLSTMGS